MNKPYTEPCDASEHARREYAESIFNLSHTGFDWLPENESASEYEKVLGAPLDRKVNTPLSFSQEYVGCDELCEIFRVRILALPSLPFYGLVFVPKGERDILPLCIAAHGHLGTPELMYGMHGKNGYSDIIRRLIRRGFAVFAPQFLHWNYGFNPAKPHYSTVYDRLMLDTALKSHGGGICALEIFCLRRAIDALSTVRSLDLSNLCVCGMSYGAYYTMRTMAVDARIKCGYFMSCFDSGLDERFPEWFVRDGFITPRDGEIAAMCAPRPILIEVGEHDDIFPPDGARREAATAYRIYKKLGAGDNFNLRIWNGAHLVCPEDYGIEFMKKSSVSLI